MNKHILHTMASRAEARAWITAQKLSVSALKSLIVEMGFKPVATNKQGHEDTIVNTIVGRRVDSEAMR